MGINDEEATTLKQLCNFRELLQKLEKC